MLVPLPDLPGTPQPLPTELLEPAEGQEFSGNRILETSENNPSTSATQFWSLQSGKIPPKGPFFRYPSVEETLFYSQKRQTAIGVTLTTEGMGGKKANGSNLLRRLSRRLLG